MYLCRTIVYINLLCTFLFSKQCFICRLPFNSVVFRVRIRYGCRERVIFNDTIKCQECDAFKGFYVSLESPGPSLINLIAAINVIHVLPLAISFCFLSSIIVCPVEDKPEPIPFPNTCSLLLLF